MDDRCECRSGAAPGWKAFLVTGLPLAAGLLFAGVTPRLAAASLDEAEPAVTATEQPGLVREVGIDQHLGRQVPGDIPFADETGATGPLGRYFGTGRPIILVPAYFRCPMLCTQVLNGVFESLRMVSLEPGKDYEVVVVSFDPREKPPLAAAKKAAYVESFGRPGAAAGWHFLTGTAGSVERLTGSIGFRFRYDKEHDQFAHASGVMLLTPQGKLSRYFYGITFAPTDLRLGLVESSANKVGSLVDQVLLFCYHYDSKSGRYTGAVLNLVRLGGALTVLALAAGFVVLSRRPRPAAPPGPDSTLG